MAARGFRLSIDFGTSNTVAVLAWPDGPVRPLLFDGSPLLPSGVYADPAAGLLAGRDAALAARVGPDRFEPYPKQRVDDGTVLLGDLGVPVEDLIAAVLRRVALEAARVAGGPLVETVLTYPASWGAPRRGILRHAAGTMFAEPWLVPEPVAAASYFVRTGGPVPVGGCAVVYDLGAGTFDASVVRRTADGFEVLSERGLTDAGGLDVDAAIVAQLAHEYAPRDAVRWARLTRPATAEDNRLRRTFWDDVRAGKEMLSRIPATVLHVPLFDDDVPLGREQLDDLARPILERTVETTRACLRAAGIAVPDLAGLFLVGGSSRLPLAATLLHRAFGIPPTVTDQPELVVAEGALSARPAGSTTRPTIPPPGATPPGATPPALPVEAATPPPATPPRRLLTRVGVLGASLIVAALATVGGIALVDQYREGARATGSATPSPSPSAGPAAAVTPLRTPTAAPVTGPKCLIGTWRQTLNRARWPVNGVTVSVTSKGTINRFRADGVAVVEYLGAGVTRTGKAGGNTYKITSKGVITFDYDASASTIYLRNAEATGTLTTKINGRVVERGAMVGSVDPERYTCTGDKLRFWNSRWTIDAVRLSTTG